MKSNFIELEKIPVVILAGGLGTRLREQTEFIPKPMVPIGTQPILWHIMKIYSHFGFSRFIICTGYKGEAIREYFLQYRYRNSDFTINLENHQDIKIHNSPGGENWKVTLADTGLNTMTGARIKKIEQYVNSDFFCLTYGDGLADIKIDELIRFHLSQGKIATITGVRPPSRFGELITQGDMVTEFAEKSQVGVGLINGGFFVFNKKIFYYLEDKEDCTLEKEPLERIAEERQLVVFRHLGFWQCMDTLRDMKVLNDHWGRINPPWKAWE